VRVAAEVLGVETVAGTLPMLQPVALTGTTRAALRRAGNVLHQVREQILAFHPTVEAEPVRLERLRPRTLFTVVAMSVALYALLSQLTRVNLNHLLGSMSWGWALAAVVASALTYVGAAMSLGGFVPEKLPPTRLLLSQVAASFVSVVTPSAVGGATVNTRFLQKAGVQPGLAVTSVGASQLVGMVIHILLLMLFGFISGTQRGVGLPPSTTLIAVLLTVAVLILAVVAIGPLRHYALDKLRPFFSGVVPRMLDLAQAPAKLATGIGGATLLSLMYISCLWASIQAFGAGPNATFAKVAVIFLAGQAVGSAVPTPGGIGTVDTALAFGVSSLGPSTGTAVLAVFLFRLVTLWLPVIPGWIAFTWMHRNDAL
jgi:glycosyltransferase 2 family protein